MAAPRKGGRPPRAKVAATARVELRITPGELAAWRRAAGELSLSEWLRQLANQAATSM